MASQPVALIPYASSAQTRELQAALASVGQPLQLMDPAGRPPVDVVRTGPTCSLLLIGSHDRPVADILSDIRARRLPAIAVFCRDVVPFSAELAAACDDFLCWPCDPQELALRIGRLRAAPAAMTVGSDDAALIEEFANLNLIGRSSAFLAALRLLKRIAGCDVPLLIEGETGTGKELAARAVHYLGARRDHPFIPVNCGAIPENLVENELFGHERGAFTDAKEAQAGLIAQAEGGTLFLDEVEALSPKAQVALLRFLQDHHYRPLGSRHSRCANVRVITASNCSLDALVGSGQFRQDLLFRLKIMAIMLPPLRDRAGDAELLAEHFLRRFRIEHRRAPVTLDPGTREWIRLHRWPGNVRELENLLLRELLLAEADTVRFDTAPSRSERRAGVTDRRGTELPAGPMRIVKGKVIAEFERAFLCRLLAETGGNVSEAARRAGKERRAFGKLLSKYGIDKHQS